MNVLMFHSVGNYDSKWSQNWLSMSKIHFEQFCKYLSKKKYKTEFLDNWYENENKLNKGNKNIYLTFDDGYLDNWLVAFPILKSITLKQLFL